MVGIAHAPYLFSELEVSFEFPLTFRLTVADDGRDDQYQQYSLHFGSGCLPPTSSITRLDTQFTFSALNVYAERMTVVVP